MTANAGAELDRVSGDSKEFWGDPWRGASVIKGDRFNPQGFPSIILHHHQVDPGFQLPQALGREWEHSHARPGQPRHFLSSKQEFGKETWIA